MTPQKVMPDDMIFKSICLKCKKYDRKKGLCTGTNPFAKAGDKHYLVLADKTACFGFEEAE
jgi:hypothetical protein